jgi:mannose-1-phosphate guanylyltransferase
MSNFWVVTNAKYVDIVKLQLPDVPAEHILAEPAARNTAPCIAWACWSIKKEDSSANVVVTPADAVVMNPEEFRRVIINALAFTESHNAIVTIGIKPSRPETGYGYVQFAEEVEGEIEECKFKKINFCGEDIILYDTLRGSFGIIQDTPVSPWDDYAEGVYEDLIQEGEYKIFIKVQ